MNTYVFMPTNDKEQRLLSSDVNVNAGSLLAAKYKVREDYPGFTHYKLVDIIFGGLSAIQRDREKSGFGMIY